MLELLDFRKLYVFYNKEFWFCIILPHVLKQNYLEKLPLPLIY